MYDEAHAVEEILSCIDRINEQLPPDHRIEKADDTILVGEGSRLDSLTLINLLVEIEETVSVSSRHRLSILEETLMHDAGPRFSTVRQLAKWIAERT